MNKGVFITLLMMCVLAIGGVMYANGNSAISGGDDMYMVSHSEYWSNEEGQIIVRLYNWQGAPIVVDNCSIDIYYPDKTLFITSGLTDDSLQVTTGTHYYNFTTPTTEGVYQYVATCEYNNKERSVASSFHLSPALNFQLVINNSIATLTAQELAHYLATQDNLSSIISSLGIIDTNVDTLLINVSSVYTDTQYIRDNMLSGDNITSINNKLDGISGNITELKAYCNTTETSTSQLCAWVSSINTMVTDINATSGQYNAILNEINSTTTSTYDYITGTLASNINTLLGTTGRIEINTIQINDTVNSISSDVNTIDSKVDTITTNLTTVINNQEDTVYMEVSS